MKRRLSMVVGVVLLAGCPSFPDPIRPGSDAGGPDTAAGDLGQRLDSAQPDAPLPDAVVKPDAPPVLPDAPVVPDTTSKQPLGAVCGVGAHCASGYCADYTCCDNACAGTCEACNVAGSVGTCTAVPDGADPRHDCNASPPDSCGDDGQCDGKGACRKWSAGTPCGKPQCSTSSHELTNVKACDGSGSCVSAPDITCDPFSCSTSTDQCYTSCTDKNEGYTCQGYYGCNSSKQTCYTSCTSDSQCTSSGTCKKNKCIEDDDH